MFLITASLLNSWQRLFEADDSEKELQSFLSYLKREEVPPNEYMLRGIEFEKQCYDGLVPDISPIVKDGIWQLSATKEVKVNGYDVLMYGRLDCLKCGIIYDIKRVSQHETQKYFSSYQHHFYFDLIPEAFEFQYLISDGETVVIEKYGRDEKIDLIPVIGQFYDWLKSRNLFEIYATKWLAKSH